nr:winged helix-turn-helix domain-containing protein [Amycolatopsis umgeniensis]
MRRVRGGLPEPKTLLCGALKIDTRTRRVWVGDREVGLTRKEFDFLHLLASRPETVFSRRLIMSKVWECDDSTGSRTIDTHVSGLRNKLGGSSWIVTVRGVGFRLGNG